MSNNEVITVFKRNSVFIRAGSADEKKPLLQSPSKQTYLPRTSITVIYALLIVAGFIISVYLIAMAINERSENNYINTLINNDEASSMQINQGIYDLQQDLIEIRDHLIIIENQIDILQLNVTDLGNRIYNIICSGIRVVNNDVITRDLFVESGLSEFFEVQNTGSNEIIINGTRLQLLLNAEAVSIELLQNLLASVNAALALLESQTVKYINSNAPVDNNINFEGVCNATVTGQNPSQVVVGACAVYDAINARFNLIYNEFQYALQTLAIIQQNITYINSVIISIETIISDVQANALFRVNERFPNENGTIILSAEDQYINVTGTTIENKGLLTINNIASESGTSNFVIEAGSGISITNNPGTGEVTVGNLAAISPCQIRQTTLSTNINMDPQFVVATPFQTRMRVNFDSNATTTTPSGCYTNASSVFYQTSTFFPAVTYMDTVCKPEGRWILGVSFYISSSGFSAADGYLNLMFGLGSEGAVQSSYFLASINRFLSTGALITTYTYNEFTLTDTSPWCYNVTYYLTSTPGADVINNGLLSDWTFTRIN